MEANVKYNNYKGTAAADWNDKKLTDFNLDECLKSSKVDLERYEKVGYKIITGVGKAFGLSVILLDKNRTDRKYLIEMYLKDVKIDDLFDIFKRFEVVLYDTNNDYSNTEINEIYDGSIDNKI